MSAAAARLIATVLLSAWVGDAAVSELRSGVLALSVDETTGAYNVTVDSIQWFWSGATVFSADQKLYTTSNGSLVMSGAPKVDQGSDQNGDFNRITIDWSRAGSSQPEWNTAFKAYQGTSQGSRNALAFVQGWLTGSTGTVGSQFPALMKAEPAPKSLGALEYTGTSCGFMVGDHGTLGITGGHSKGMIVIAPHDSMDNGTSATLVFGPVKEMFANQAMSLNGDGIAYGLANSFEFAPKGYVLETLLVATAKSDTSPGAQQAERASMPNGGVNAALAEYGDFLLTRHDKTRSGPAHNVEVAYLGYSTTGFYFYNLCDCLDPIDNVYKRRTCKKSPIPGCNSYGDTLIAVNEGLKRQGIPYRHMLLDSWWYGENWFGGAYEWEDNDVVRNVSFPMGLASFWNTIGKNITMWAHNGKWTSSTPYKDNYTFSDNTPQGRALWDHLFSANKAWGLQTIKQDHMAEQMGDKNSWKNVSVLKSWLTGMGDGAAANNVSVLYCCAPPNVHMNGVTVPAAFGVRASPDYVWVGGGRVLKLPQVQWAIGPDSAFHWNGLGLLPYKDTFFSNSTATPEAGAWSSDPKQWVPFTGFHEVLPQTHALISTLSMAQVTFTDGVGMANKTLLMQICRQDGLVLKPDRPATAIDAQFQAMMFGSWPGPAKPKPGHGALTLSQCDDSQNQRWLYGSNGQLSVSVSEGSKPNITGCIDIARCSTEPGALVDLFPNPAGCGNPPGTCGGHNELWKAQDSQIVSVLDNSLCLRVDGASSTVSKCDSMDPAQQWHFKQTKSSGVVQIQQGGSDLCLTGTSITPSTKKPRPSSTTCEADHGIPAEKAFAKFSPAMRAALTISDSLVQRLESRDHESCDLASPQGPLGEVYSTHTTIANVGTWHLLLGIQLSANYSVYPKMLLNSRAPSFSTPKMVFKWSDLDTFSVANSPSSFDTTSPITLTPEQAADLYPIQYYVIAPVLDHGWTLLGERGKFVPISNQRISAISVTPTTLTVSVKGVAGETVIMGAWPQQEAHCTVSTNGRCDVVFRK